MTATAERRGQDLAKLATLCRQSQGWIRMMSKAGQPLREVVVELAYRTAPCSEYPSRVQDHTRVRIELSDRYPFHPRQLLSTGSSKQLVAGGAVLIQGVAKELEGLPLFCLVLHPLVQQFGEGHRIREPADRIHPVIRGAARRELVLRAAGMEAGVAPSLRLGNTAPNPEIGQSRRPHLPPFRWPGARAPGGPLDSRGTIDEAIRP